MRTIIFGTAVRTYEYLFDSSKSDTPYSALEFIIQDWYDEHPDCLEMTYEDALLTLPLKALGKYGIYPVNQVYRLPEKKVRREV